MFARDGGRGEISKEGTAALCFPITNACKLTGWEGHVSYKQKEYESVSKRDKCLKPSTVKDVQDAVLPVLKIVLKQSQAPW